MRTLTLPVNRAGWNEALILVLALVAGAIVHWPIFSIRPLGTDNFRTLAWVDWAPFTALGALDPAMYPQWRPLTHATIWLEHRLVPLDQVAIHHAVNLVIWAACITLVYRMARQLACSQSAATLAAVVLFADSRSVEALTVIQDRQTTMAIAFGLWALAITIRVGEERLNGVERAMVVGALLAAAFSKEYGLAYAGALATYGLWNRRRDLSGAALAAVATYAVTRWWLANGAVAVYCEDMGYFLDTAPQCMNAPNALTLTQATYNMAAATIGIPLRGVFDAAGRISVDLAPLVVSLVLATMVVRAMVAGPRQATLLFLVLPFNALLSFMVYRDRSLLIGAAAMAILVAIGYDSFRRASHGKAVLRHTVVSVTIALILALGSLTAAMAAETARQASDMRRDDPCFADERRFEYGARFVSIVKRRYGLANADCVLAPAR